MLLAHDTLGLAYASSPLAKALYAALNEDPDTANTGRCSLTRLVQDFQTDIDEEFRIAVADRQLVIATPLSFVLHHLILQEELDHAVLSLLDHLLHTPRRRRTSVVLSHV